MFIIFIGGKKKEKKNNEKTHHQKESEISHRMEDETPSVSYHSNLTLQHPSGLSHLHWNICLVKQTGKCLCLEQ